MTQVSLSRKKELMEPDEVEVFLKGIVEKVLQYKTLLLIGLIVLCSGVLAVSAIYYHFNHKEMNASMELGKIVSQYEDEGDQDKGFPEVSSRYKTFFDTYSGTRSSQFAGLRYANLCYQEKQFDDAITYYKKSLKQFSDNRALTTLIHLSLGYTYLAKKEYDAAKIHFETVVEDKGALVKEEALFQLGLVYGMMGDQAKRDELFGQVASLEKSMIYTDIVKEKVRK